MAILEQYPYVDEFGVEHEDLVKHYSDNEKPIVQLQTGNEYEEAIDTYPCKYVYVQVEEAAEANENGEENPNL